MSISINVNRSVTEFPQEQTNSYAVGNENIGNRYENCRQTQVCRSAGDEAHK